MTFYWIYDLSNLQLGILVILTCIVLAVGGFYLTRPLDQAPPAWSMKTATIWSAWSSRGLACSMVWRWA